MNMHTRNIICEESFRKYYDEFVSAGECRLYLRGMIDFAEYMDNINPKEKEFYVNMNDNLYLEYRVKE